VSTHAAPPLAYLDHAATTPMRAEAVEAMVALLADGWGNPSGSHAVARRARRALDEARDVVAASLGCQPAEVVFTAGGTEADNLAVTGVVQRRGGVAVCPASEHHAVLHPVEHAKGRVVGVDGAGAVDLGALAEALDDTVSIVSVMTANNEVGTVTDLAAVAEVVRTGAPGAVLHTDAVQAFTWLDVAAHAAPADLVSVSAHKFGGPQGVGALVVRTGVALDALLLGGGQEHERRSGTQNLAGIVAMAAAMRAAVDERAATVARVGALRDRLADGLLAMVPGLVETVPRARKVAGACHVCIEGVESESLLFLLDRAGVAASAASACASGAQEASHVLAAMGVPRSLAAGALRLSLGRDSTDADVDAVLAVLPDAVARLREAA
jgi:cysteine desulfurase